MIEAWLAGVTCKMVNWWAHVMFTNLLTVNNRHPNNAWYIIIVSDITPCYQTTCLTIHQHVYNSSLANGSLLIIHLYQCINLHHYPLANPCRALQPDNDYQFYEGLTVHFWAHKSIDKPTNKQPFSVVYTCNYKQQHAIVHTWWCPQPFRMRSLE